MLKKEYTQFMELKLAATGLGWDEERGTIEVNDDWWEIHLKVRVLPSYTNLPHSRIYSFYQFIMLCFHNYPKHAKWRHLGPPKFSPALKVVNHTGLAWIYFSKCDGWPFVTLI
jgi:hypothetical protein